MCFQSERECDCVSNGDSLVSHNSNCLNFLTVLYFSRKCNQRLVSREIGLCKKLVGNFFHSWKKEEAITEAQRGLKLHS